MATVADRIREVLARTGWSQRELSRRSELSPAAIGWILSHPDRTTELDTIRKIAKGAGVSEAWLATGRGSADDEQPGSPPAVAPIAGRGTDEPAAAGSPLERALGLRLLPRAPSGCRGALDLEAWAIRFDGRGRQRHHCCHRRSIRYR